MKMLVDNYFNNDLETLANSEKWLDDDFHEIRKKAEAEEVVEGISEDTLDELAATWEGSLFAQMAAKIIELEKAVAGLKAQLDEKNSCC